MTVEAAELGYLQRQYSAGLVVAAATSRGRGSSRRREALAGVGSPRNRANVVNNSPRSRSYPQHSLWVRQLSKRPRRIQVRGATGAFTKSLFKKTCLQLPALPQRQWCLEINDHAMSEPAEKIVDDSQRRLPPVQRGMTARKQSRSPQIQWPVRSRSSAERELTASGSQRCVATGARQAFDRQNRSRVPGTPKQQSAAEAKFAGQNKEKDEWKPTYNSRQTYI